MTHFSPIQKAQTGTFCFINIPFFYVFLSSKTWQAARLSCPRVETMNLIVSLHCHRLVSWGHIKIRLLLLVSVCCAARCRAYFSRLRHRPVILIFPIFYGGVRNLVLIAWQTGADCTMKWCWLHCKQVLFVFRLPPQGWQSLTRGDTSAFRSQWLLPFATRFPLSVFVFTPRCPAGISPAGFGVPIVF